MTLSQVIKLPVSGSNYSIADLSEPGTPVPHQFLRLTKRDYELPLLYLTYTEQANVRYLATLYATL